MGTEEGSRPRRYELLDSLRGIALVSMILYHFLWDCVYLFHMPASWFSGNIGDFWQKSICCSFILLSGFCCGLGRHPIRRGWIVTAAGGVITLVTLIVVPEQRVVFGILTLLGASMILTGVLQKILNRIFAPLGMAAAFLLFLICAPVNDGYLNLGFFTLSLPKDWYWGYGSAFLGFPHDQFFSTDYFSLIPWYFLFLTGYFLYQWIKSSSLFHRYGTIRIPFFSMIGKHSLPLYLVHQPVLYGALVLWGTILA